MTKTNKVYIVKLKRTPNFVLRWKNGGIHYQQSTGTPRRREAERLAAAKERELETQLSPASWEAIRERFEREHVAKTDLRTQTSYRTALNSFEAEVDPQAAAELTSENLQRWVQAMQQSELSPNTIKSYLRHLRPLLKLCIEWGLISRVPVAKAPRPTKSAKGRPLTREEFERILSVVPRIVGEKYADDWRFNLQVLWLSGLRLGETLSLTWDDPTGMQFQGLWRWQPMLWIPAGRDKSRREELIPLTPDLVRFLRDSDPELTGPVFRWRLANGSRCTRTDTVSKRIAAMGRAAKVVSGTNTRGEPVYASAHDFRRSFGDRWAPVLQPADLQKLMRHRSFTTTLQHYVSVRAHDVGERINKAFKERIDGSNGTVQGRGFGGVLGPVVGIDGDEP